MRWHVTQGVTGLGNVDVLGAMRAGECPDVAGAQLLLARHAVPGADRSFQDCIDDVLHESRSAHEVGANRMLRALPLHSLTAPYNTEKWGIFDRYGGVNFAQNTPVSGVEGDFLVWRHQWQ